MGNRWLVLCVTFLALVAICGGARNSTEDHPTPRIDNPKNETNQSTKTPDDRDHDAAVNGELQQENEMDDMWEPQEHGEDEHAEHIFDETPAQHLLEHWGTDGHIDKHEISFLLEHLEHNTCHAHHGEAHKEQHGHLHHGEEDNDRHGDHEDDDDHSQHDDDDDEKGQDDHHHGDSHDSGEKHHDEDHEDDHEKESKRLVTPAMMVSRFGLYGALNVTGFEIACPMIMMCQLEPGCELYTGEEIDGHEHAVEEESTELLKVVAAVVLFVEAIIGALVPFVVGRFEQFKVWLSILNSFSGGIFLSAGFVHMIPIVAESEEELKPLKNNYSLGSAMVLGGFLLMFYVDRVVCGIEKEDVDLSANQATNTVSSSVKITNNARSRSSRRREIQSSKSSKHSRKDAHLGWARIKAPMVLFMAVFVHALLEAVSLGLDDGRHGVLLQFASMGSHKGVASMALAARLVRSNASKRQVLILMGMFALVAPVGIVCSYAFSGVPALVVLILNGLATGVFIYIGAFEVVADEFGRSNGEGDAVEESQSVRKAKYLAMALGTLLLSILQLIPHEHEL
ncbi:hypothetical protein BSKO_10451 [Bryopsis sp. KO-2023]|nr:hypothetical protein BSKO_10451 [Bryopsis sp. KO-2023]